MLDSEEKEITFSGDLNCNLLGDDLSGNSSKLYEVLNLCQLHQVITEPARVTSNHESLIDILATNRPEKLLNSGILHSGISGHSLVHGCFKISIPKQKQKFVQGRSFKHYIYNVQFKRDLLLALD